MVKRFGPDSFKKDVPQVFVWLEKKSSWLVFLYVLIKLQELFFFLFKRLLRRFWPDPVQLPSCCDVPIQHIKIRFLASFFSDLAVFVTHAESLDMARLMYLTVVTSWTSSPQWRGVSFCNPLSSPPFLHREVNCLHLQETGCH